MPSRLSSLLVRDGLVGVRRMEKAFQRQVIYGGSLDTILLELGMVPEDRLCQYLALASGLPPASRAETEHLDPAAVQLLPLESAQAYRAVPLALEGEAVRMAVASPIDLAALEDLADHVDRPLRPLLVPEYRWHVMLEQAYGVPTPQRFAALASQIEKDPASQPVGRARTVIVENEPERDIVANAPPLPIVAAEPVRTRGRATDNLTQVAVAPPRSEPPGPPPGGPTSSTPPPRETSQSMRRRATLIGVSPVRALTDEPLTGDLIPQELSPASGIPRPITNQDGEDLEAAESRGPWHDDLPRDDRPTGPRRAQPSPEELATIRGQSDTRPIGRRRATPDSLAAISAASLSAVAEAQPADNEVSDDDLVDEREVTRSPRATGAQPRASEQVIEREISPSLEPLSRRAPTQPEPLLSTTLRQGAETAPPRSAGPRRLRADTLDTQIEDVSRELPAVRTVRTAPAEPAPDVPDVPDAPDEAATGAAGASAATSAMRPIAAPPCTVSSPAQRAT